jgi:hypothetical protein
MNVDAKRLTNYTANDVGGVADEFRLTQAAASALRFG